MSIICKSNKERHQRAEKRTQHLYVHLCMAQSEASALAQEPLLNHSPHQFAII